MRSSGISPATVMVLAMLVIGAVALFEGSWRTRRVSRRRVAEARAELRHQIDFLAEKILALSDRVTIAPAEAQEAYTQAATAFRQASDGFSTARTEAQLTRLNDSLDRARWQLEVATSVLEGKALPPGMAADAPACFFDPDHGAGIRQATLQTPAGDRQVGVCDYCATKLDHGEAPEPRRIPVGGDAVPVSMAPREYGGLGMRDLDAFSVRFGRGGPVSYHWGGSHPGRSRRHHSSGRRG